MPNRHLNHSPNSLATDSGDEDRGLRPGGAHLPGVLNLKGHQKTQASK